MNKLLVSANPANFFFQAEDGIRDLIVTGVQTCALPITEGRDPTRIEPAGATKAERAYGADRKNLNWVMPAEGEFEQRRRSYRRIRRLRKGRDARHRRDPGRRTTWPSA